MIIPSFNFPSFALSTVIGPRGRKGGGGRGDGIHWDRDTNWCVREHRHQQQQQGVDKSPV